jgi:hypothetical protein
MAPDSDPPRRQHTREMVGVFSFRDSTDWSVHVSPAFDEHLNTRNGEETPPCLFPGAILFIYLDFAGDFCRDVLPRIKVPIIVVAGSGDYPDPWTEHCAHLLDHPMVMHWQVQNVRPFNVSSHM